MISNASIDPKTLSLGSGETIVRFSVVTPCYNSAHYLEETIESVLNQTAFRSGRAQLDYWIIDGGSTDDTPAILEKYRALGVNVICERDGGMYDALAKGFRRVKGEICCYINAGDYYHPNAFDVVLEVMANNSVHWLMGMYIIYNEKSQVILAQHAKRRDRVWIQKGYYGRLLPHLQQESTFWRSELLKLVDFERLIKFRFAGDFYLWHCFATKHELRSVSSYLGGFKFHAGQLSEQADRYSAEVEQICGRKINILDRASALASRILEKFSTRSFLISIGYDRSIYWDNQRQCWIVN